MPHSPHMQTSVIPLLYLQRHVAGNGSASRVPLPSVPPVHLGPLLTVASQRYVAFEGKAPGCLRVALQRSCQLAPPSERCTQRRFEH